MESIGSIYAKIAYGLDVSGEVIDPGSSNIANRENQTNTRDTAEPQEHLTTSENPTNLLHDTQADAEFPELKDFKNKRVQWPPRIR